jgi:hypothetical protein
LIYNNLLIFEFVKFKTRNSKTWKWLIVKSFEFNLGLYSINFWSQRSNSIFQRWFFKFFMQIKVINKYKNDKFQLSPTRSFDWCINFEVLRKLTNFYFFTHWLWPKFTKFVFLPKISKFIHQSKDLAELSWNISFLSFVNLTNSKIIFEFCEFLTRELPFSI